jgi:hypothetical protein
MEGSGRTYPLLGIYKNAVRMIDLVFNNAPLRYGAAKGLIKLALLPERLFRIATMG